VARAQPVGVGSVPTAQVTGRTGIAIAGTTARCTNGMSVSGCHGKIPGFSKWRDDKWLLRAIGS
jgi:hypothetical protein